MGMLLNKMVRKQGEKKNSNRKRKGKLDFTKNRKVENRAFSGEKKTRPSTF
jgi:hypothetical protein